MTPKRIQIRAKPRRGSGATLLGFEVKAFAAQAGVLTARSHARTWMRLLPEHGIYAPKQIRARSLRQDRHLEPRLCGAARPRGSGLRRAKQLCKLIRFRDFRVATERSAHGGLAEQCGGRSASRRHLRAFAKKVPRFTRLVFVALDQRAGNCRSCNPERDGQALNLWRGLTFEPRRGNIDPYFGIARIRLPARTTNRGIVRKLDRRRAATARAQD